MSVHNIREQLNQVLMKVGLKPKPKEVVIKTEDTEFVVCSEKD